MSKKVSTTPPKLISKDAAARELGCDRRTLSKVIDAFEIDPAGKSATGNPLYDLGDLREALMDHRAAQLPPMTQAEITASQISLLSFGWLALDYLAETLPADILRDARNAAMERRMENQEPQCLWLQSV
jgi:hypothetical protein